MHIFSVMNAFNVLMFHDLIKFCDSCFCFCSVDYVCSTRSWKVRGFPEYESRSHILSQTNKTSAKFFFQIYKIKNFKPPHISKANTQSLSYSI